MISSNLKLDIPQLIQQIQSKSPESSSKKPLKLFPYIETYGRAHDCEENLLMNKTIKFRESYIHNRTLRYMEPTFSYHQVLAKLKTDILLSRKPQQKMKARSFDRESQKLKEIINKTEMMISRESQPTPRIIRQSKAKSQFPNGITKVSKQRYQSEDYGRVSPDILRVTNYTIKTPRKKTPKKKVENLTFYKEIPVTQDTHASDYIYIKPRYPNKAKTIRDSPKLTCDAISNTDLSNS
jgi:hypothetical protein